MTSKAGIKRVGLSSPPASTSSAAQFPTTLQQLTPQSKISASCIPLSPGFSVHYAVFSALHVPQGHFDIAVARAKVYLENNAGRTFKDSLLTYSQVSKDESALWVFCIDCFSQAEAESPVSRLHNLELNGLTKKVYDKFSYAELYPCSAACSTQRTPCETCLLLSAPDSPRNRASNCIHVKSDPVSTSCPCANNGNSTYRLSVACHLPRQPLRQPLAFFLSAVRERIINDICENTQIPGMSARRFGSGILWGSSSSLGKWGDGWDQHWKTRPLIYSHIEATLLESSIFIQPHFRTTHFLPFLPSLPLPSGTPINLLPFSTPAYYLNTYSGSTSALTRQFQTSLVGLGAGDLYESIGSETEVQFVIAWISVQNKQGEDKGMIIIWPAPLCVALMSMIETPNDADDKPAKLMFAYNRKPLAYMPELPLALQSSPVPAPATVPIPLRLRSGSPHEDLVSPSLFTPVGYASLSREATPTTPFPRSATHPLSKPTFDRTFDRPPLIHAISSFSPSTTQAFRTLTMSALPPSGMRNVAEGVGKFVDSMAKERERERERIKREKEREASVAVSAGTPNANANMPSQVQGMKGLTVGVGTPQSPGVVPSSATSSILNSLHTITLNTPNSVPGPTQLMPPITLNTQTPQPNPQQAPTQQPSIPPNHPSYPSPPEEVGKADQTTSTSGSYSSEASASSVAQQTHTQFGPAQPSSAPFDSFDNMDKFMMDLGMDFNMSLPSSATHQGENMKMDFDSLGVFTDDDFNFFDDPVVPTTTIAAPAVAASLQGSNNDVLKDLGITSLGHEALESTVAAPLTPFEKSSPWATTKQTDRSSTAERGEPIAPELLPGSPEGSSSSSAGPATPEVISTSDAQAVESETNPFDPIRFSRRFHSVDAKYAIGKFSHAFIEKDPMARETSISVLWRTSYDTLTDPRIEVVKKLIGMKRKLLTQGIRSGLPSPPFQEPRSEWDMCVAEDNISAMDVDSERESDSDDQNMDEYEGGDDSVSRPSTPLASHLPLGPTLIATQFQHSLLLPLSVNLKPPGAAFAATLDMASPLPNPVPTPVSPAAVLGSAGEKTKSLEVLVGALAVEVVENPLWEAAWRASSAARAPIWKHDECHEVDDGSTFLSSGWVCEPMKMETFSSLASVSEVAKSDKAKMTLKTLDQPMFTVGKADLLVQMSPPSLRFWSKLGLTPLSGPKDVVAFVLYEEGGKSLAEVEAWMNRVSCLYNSKAYGKHSLGKSALCSKDGFVPVRYPTFRKTFASLVDSLGSISSPIVLYVVTPGSILSLSSPVLRQILSSINRVLSARADDTTPIRFHLVPDSILTFKDDITSTSQLEAFVDNVYNRIPRPVDRFMSRPFFAHGEKKRKYFEAPGFTLARTSPPPTSLSFQYPPPESSCIDKYTLLHVGYKVTKCKQWLLAACIDQRGEGHDLGVWSVGEDNDWKHLVSLVWTFAMEFAKRANVEWRIAIARLGSICEAELEAWNAFLNNELSDPSQVPPLHVSLLCVDDESGWSVLPEHSPALPSQKPPYSSDSHGHGKNIGHGVIQHPGQGQASGQGQVFSSLNSTYILPSLRLHVPSPVDMDLGAPQFIPEDDESVSHLHSSDRLRPLLTSALITAPSSSGNAPRAQFIHLLFTTTFPGSTLTKTGEHNLHDICQNYYELAVLTQARWHLNTQRKEPLPYHLAALRTVDTSLELSDMVLE